MLHEQPCIFLDGSLPDEVRDVTVPFSSQFWEHEHLDRFDESPEHVEDNNEHRWSAHQCLTQKPEIVDGNIVRRSIVGRPEGYRSAVERKTYQDPLNR